MILGQKDIIPWSLIFIHDKKYLKNAKSTKISCITIAGGMVSAGALTSFPHGSPACDVALYCLQEEVHR